MIRRRVLKLKGASFSEISKQIYLVFFLQWLLGMIISLESVNHTESKHMGIRSVCILEL